MAKSSRDFVDWRQMYPSTLNEQSTVDYWNNIRDRSAASIGVSGQMPFVFNANRVAPLDPMGKVDPAFGPPGYADVAANIQPNLAAATANNSTSNTSSQWQSSLLSVLEELARQPGFETLGPLLEQLGSTSTSSTT